MSYKAKARAYFTAVNNYDIEKIEQMVDENYIQHNPFVPNGRSAFVAFIPKLKSHGSQIRNKRIIEDGVHVIMHHRWEKGAPFGAENIVAFHIIRFDSQERIAEHWSVMMEDTLRNSSSHSLADGSVDIEDLSKTVENKAMIQEFFTGLMQNPKEVLKLRRLIGEEYSQPKISQSFLNSDIQYIKQHKIFGEGNFCLSIAEGLCAEISTAIYDLFRIESGRIVEHWRIAQPIPTANLANENTMFGF